MTIDLEKVLEGLRCYFLESNRSERHLFYDEENYENYTVVERELHGHRVFFVTVRQLYVYEFKIVEYFLYLDDLLEYVRKEMSSPRYEFELANSSKIDGHIFKIVKKKIGE